MLKTALGTPFYLSPELCKEIEYSFKADIWMLGCLLFEICNLEKPFYSDNIDDLLYKIINEKQKDINKK